MLSQPEISDIHLSMTYVQDGKNVEVSGDLAWAQWEVENDYEDVIHSEYGRFGAYSTSTNHMLKSSPKTSMEMKVGKREVREVLHTAEIQASGSTVAALEEAREAVGAPSDALVQIDKWSYPEAIEVSAKDPVKVRFSWREER